VPGTSDLRATESSSQRPLSSWVATVETVQIANHPSAITDGAATSTALAA
jgi:hypothetical protein